MQVINRDLLSCSLAVSPIFDLATPSFELQSWSIEVMFWYFTLGLVVACWYLLDRFLHVPHDKAEPPLVPYHVPWIGHLLGILQRGSNYYSDIRSEVLVTWPNPAVF